MAETTEGNIPDVDRSLQETGYTGGSLTSKLEEKYEDTDTWLAIKAWLDSQKTKSVVHVSFGSEAKPSQTELNEIALGLELSGLPFFWVLKTRRGPWDTEPVELPEGFEERTKERGMVWRGWVELLRTLSHDSIGLVLLIAVWERQLKLSGLLNRWWCWLLCTTKD
ncbi:unnamed protein product [Microthlaspi erraticum]|uniref:Uncharacterized protein n=1 Tax=Microthlaspi erraticum TaxID=1685480 RepID=A0A6D2I2W8_9BRAS|nr:unnamed protein product [Microthlaspi erraticum]